MDPKKLHQGFMTTDEEHIEDVDFEDIAAEQEALKDDLRDRMAEYLERYKKYTEEGKGIRPLVVLINEEGAEYDYLYPAFGPNGENKAEAYHMINNHARHTQARALVSIGEVRWVDAEDDTGGRPSENPSARPGIMIMGFTHGWKHMLVQLFERTEDGIEWGETKEEENVESEIPLTYFETEG